MKGTSSLLAAQAKNHHGSSCSLSSHSKASRYTQGLTTSPITALVQATLVFPWVTAVTSSLAFLLLPSPLYDLLSSQQLQDTHHITSHYITSLLCLDPPSGFRLRVKNNVLPTYGGQALGGQPLLTPWYTPPLQSLCFCQ